MSVPPAPLSFARPDLEACGFKGWQTWDALRRSLLSGVPLGPAVYVVYRPAASKPTFLPANPGGRFKEKDPTAPVGVLREEWVSGAHVLYIGKADVARKRLMQFAKFGAGEKIGHWGGRYIWQLADSAEQLVAWHSISWGEEAKAYEKRLFVHFAALHGGARPFANLTG